MFGLFNLFGSGPTFAPDTDIPDLTGKVIIVTGGNNGLGKESIRQLAKHRPAKIYMGARDETKARAAIAELVASKREEAEAPNILFLPLDLSSFASVRRAADAFLAENDRLDVLMNNAGIMACPAGRTAEGYELQFGTNHMGHALLTKLLLPVLERTAARPDGDGDVRIVNLSSLAHAWTPAGGLVVDQLKTDMASTDTWQRYGQSKLANVYFSKALARHHPRIRSVAIHPGAVNTNLKQGPMASYPWLSKLVDVGTSLLGVDVATGALNQLWAATAQPPDRVRNGAFYYPVAKEQLGSAIVQDPKMTDLLWDWTEKELKEHGF